MLYNIELNKPQKRIDCSSCKHFDKSQKKCKGLNKCCFEYDPATMTIIDGVTKLPLKLK